MRAGREESVVRRKDAGCQQSESLEECASFRQSESLERHENLERHANYAAQKKVRADNLGAKREQKKGNCRREPVVRGSKGQRRSEPASYEPVAAGTDEAEAEQN